MESIQKLVQQCLKRDRRAQRELYERLAPAMFMVCQRYARSREDAEEILQEGFVNVFEHLDQFRFTGAFEGWVRRIMVNCALQRFRKKNILHAVQPIADAGDEPADQENLYQQLEVKEMLKLVQLLPPACRMVFNLYVFENFKHREIAELLHISEGTSKSNLSDARAILRKSLLKTGQVAKQNIV